MRRFRIADFGFKNKETEVNFGLRIADLEARRRERVARHVASPSLVHYAALSFVVRGKEQ
jgi:hypothetical protein